MWRTFLVWAFVFPALVAGQQEHDHPAPEKLGTVSFAISCQPGTQSQFDRAVALLHSFAYRDSEEAFRGVAARDPQCAMVHWGIAMTQFHQLWEPPLSIAGILVGQKEIGEAEKLATGTERERGFIHALSLAFKDAPAAPYRGRASNYENAMRDLAAAHRSDVEVQVFYALALLANASPNDREHLRQKRAADVLEALYVDHPDHPGLPHYLIHACDNEEMAARGLAAARVYATIAPSAPHALHMPSHIFTRLGLWDDSIASNLAARSTAHRQGETGEELHAMDYLVYAYLQRGRNGEADQVVEDLKEMQNLGLGEFKAAYAATAMPIRCIVERQRWRDAERVATPDSAPPQVAAIAVWARGVGFGRDGQAREARREAEELERLEERLHASGNDYWAAQVNIMGREVMAWAAQAEKRPAEAVNVMRGAADEEDGIEKLPVTPGPIVPAREQLGDMLLEQGESAAAAKEFATALVNAPGRRGALLGAARAARVAAPR